MKPNLLVFGNITSGGGAFTQVLKDFFKDQIEEIMFIRFTEEINHGFEIKPAAVVLFPWMRQRDNGGRGFDVGIECGIKRCVSNFCDQEKIPLIEVVKPDSGVNQSFINAFNQIALLLNVADNLVEEFLASEQWQLFNTNLNELSKIQ